MSRLFSQHVIKYGALLSISLVILSSWLNPMAHAQTAAEEMAHAHATETAAVYACPMHPQVTNTEPSTCPICGMDLQLQKPASQAMAAVTVSLGEQQRQQLGIATQTVQSDTLWRYLPSYATLAYNTDKRVHVHPRAAGWVEQLAVRSVGTQVQQGELLYTLYSPDLVVAQQDYLQVLDSQQARPQLLRDGRLRLELLGFTSNQIKTLETSREIFYRLPVYAPQSGVVTALNMAQGKYVKPADELLTLIATDNWWLLADIPERYSNWFADNAPVDITAPSLGLRSWETQIDYIYPELAAVSQTQQVRIVLPASAITGRAQVGMQVAIELFGGPKREALVVPLTSLIMTGTNNRVMVETAPGQYQQREVEIGLIVGEQAEVVSGLMAGEQVVIAGQFMLDSEASLQQQRQQNTAPMPIGDEHANHNH